MDQTPLNLPSKQGRPNSHAASRKPSDVDVYNLIKSKEGIRKHELKLQDIIVKKSLTILEIQKQIKVVIDVYYRKHYMAVEFEASKEIIGGSWYVEGKLDAEFIKLLKDLCLKHIDKLEVVTMEGLFDHFCRSGILKVKLSSHQIFKILQALVLDNEIEEVKSTGKGFFSSVPLGKFCYRHLNWRNPMAGFMSSIPCGVCPRISECTADGFISPVNCVYIKKWLDF